MPLISVIMNTARSGYAMTGFPNRHHFEFTIEALRRQSLQDIEFIISDYMHDRRKLDWNTIRPTQFPIYHVPVTHSIFKDMGYVAISACKNNGIMFAEGEILVFLDDCSNFEGNFLNRILEIYRTQKTFPNPWHKKEVGVELQYNSDGIPVIDSRHILFDQHAKDVIVDDFHMYGYSTMSLKAALDVNGFDEMMDGSRQLEDIDMGERLKAKGYHISLHRYLFVVEQQHKQIAPTPQKHVGEPIDDFKFKENLKCNGPFLGIKKEKRTGVDFWFANNRAFSPEEQTMIRTCFLLDESSGQIKCKSSGGGCNWIDKHMMHPDSKIYFTNPPLFNLGNKRQQRLSEKQKYLVRPACQNS